MWEYGMEVVVDIILVGCYYECFVDYVVLVVWCVVYFVIGVWYELYDFIVVCI